MKEEQLIDAIGKLDADVFDEIIKIKTANVTPAANATKPATAQQASAKCVPIRAKRRSFRRWLVPVAACLALMVGGLAAYASGALDGLIRLGTDSDGNKTLEFMTPENNYVPVSELTGDVRNATAQMKDRLQYYLAGEPLPNDEMIGMCETEMYEFDGDWNNPPQMDIRYIGYEEGERPMLPYSFNVNLPGRIYKPFSSIAAAEAYIGCEGLHLPALNQTPAQIGVYVEGINEGGLRSATPDSEFEIYDIRLCASYWLDGKFAVITSANIDTVDNPGPRTTVLSHSENALLATETRTVDGREFTIVTYQSSPDSTTFQKAVFLVENRVTYILEFAGYDEASPEYVEQVITGWMNSFSQE